MTFFPVRVPSRSRIIFYLLPVHLITLAYSEFTIVDCSMVESFPP